MSELAPTNEMTRTWPQARLRTFVIHITVAIAIGHLKSLTNTWDNLPVRRPARLYTSAIRSISPLVLPEIVPAQMTWCIISSVSDLVWARQPSEGLSINPVDRIAAVFYSHATVEGDDGVCWILDHRHIARIEVKQGNCDSLRLGRLVTSSVFLTCAIFTSVVAVRRIKVSDTNAYALDGVKAYPLDARNCIVSITGCLVGFSTVVLLLVKRTYHVHIRIRWEDEAAEELDYKMGEIRNADLAREGSVLLSAMLFHYTRMLSSQFLIGGNQYVQNLTVVMFYPVFLGGLIVSMSAWIGMVKLRTFYLASTFILCFSIGVEMLVLTTKAQVWSDWADPLDGLLWTLG